MLTQVVVVVLLCTTVLATSVETVSERPDGVFSRDHPVIATQVGVTAHCTSLFPVERCLIASYDRHSARMRFCHLLVECCHTLLRPVCLRCGLPDPT
jgi:hypothetical protein